MGDWFADVAESALLAENRRFAAMLDALPDHLILNNRERILIYVNRATGEAAKSTAGMSQQELLGHRALDVVHDKRFGQYVDDCHKRALGGESITAKRLPS
jgi:PAS domain S-box-containing protein